MNIPILGKLDPLAIAVFIFSTIIFVEIAKNVIHWTLDKIFPSGKVYDYLNTLHTYPIITSWLIGFLMFHIIFVTWSIRIGFQIYLQFILGVLLANVGFIILKPIIKGITDLIKERFGENKGE